jgi:hypothetical protein
MTEPKEGWSIDITSSRSTHYYRDGVSLCKKQTVKFHMDKFDADPEYTQILGNVCTLCQKKLKLEQKA